MNFNGKMIITTPSGKSPFVLESLREDDIIHWVKLHEDYVQRGGILSLPAVKYWVRNFHNCHTPEYKYVIEIIEKNKHLFNFPKTKTHEEIMESIRLVKEKEELEKQNKIERRIKRNAKKNNRIGG